MYAYTHFQQNSHPKFHLGFSFPNLFLAYFLSAEFVLVEPEHNISV